VSVLALKFLELGLLEHFSALLPHYIMLTTKTIFIWNILQHDKTMQGVEFLQAFDTGLLINQL